MKQKCVSLLRRINWKFVVVSGYSINYLISRNVEMAYGKKLTTISTKVTENTFNENY